jgi:hypothetical protein
MVGCDPMPLTHCTAMVGCDPTSVTYCLNDGRMWPDIRHILPYDGRVWPDIRHILPYDGRVWSNTVYALSYDMASGVKSEGMLRDCYVTFVFVVIHLWQRTTDGWGSFQPFQLLSLLSFYESKKTKDHSGFCIDLEAGSAKLNMWETRAAGQESVAAAGSERQDVALSSHLDGSKAKGISVGCRLVHY